MFDVHYREYLKNRQRILFPGQVSRTLVMFALVLWSLEVCCALLFPKFWI